MKVTWGKVLMGAAVAGGAMLAFVAAEPFLEETVVPVIKDLGIAVGEKIAQAWSWIGQNVIGHAANPELIEAAHTASTSAAAAEGALAAVQQSPVLQSFVEPMSQVVEVTKATAQEASQKLAESGSALVKFIMENKPLAIGSAAAAGAMIAVRTHEAHAPLPQVMVDPERESFTMREDIRRMQALMQARAAAMGVQPSAAGMAR